MGKEYHLIWKTPTILTIALKSLSTTSYIFHFPLNQTDSIVYIFFRNRINQLYLIKGSHRIAQRQRRNHLNPAAPTESFFTEVLLNKHNCSNEAKSLIHQKERHFYALLLYTSTLQYFHFLLFYDTFSIAKQELTQKLAKNYKKI